MPKNKKFKKAPKKKAPTKKSQSRQKQRQSVNVNVKIDQSRRTTARGARGLKMQPTPLVIPNMTSSTSQDGLINDMRKKLDEKDDNTNELIKKIKESEKATNELVLRSRTDRANDDDIWEEMYDNLARINQQKQGTVRRQSPPPIIEFKDDNKPLATDLANTPEVGAPTTSDLVVETLPDEGNNEGAGEEETKGDGEPDKPDKPDKPKESTKKTKFKSYAAYIDYAITNNLIEIPKGFGTKHKNYIKVIKKGDNRSAADKKVKIEFETEYFPDKILNRDDYNIYASIGHNKRKVAPEEPPTQPPPTPLPSQADDEGDY